ncbi:hypothetical protein H105_02998 [Trichophyton soudanense CBS 452.61]|uniref:Uncharacterized protein n=1 Tax=Trichophyton soudanense CBS 452.61 TaxID=1215331 RepID=A0A022XYQ8_TRISD|nr:hypothetical protein H105_02998 [Trichophyton soudanense CBS 452.61]
MPSTLGVGSASPFLSNFHLLRALHTIRKEISPNERARRLQKKGFNPDKSSRGQERVWSELQPSTKRSYESARRIWIEYCHSNGAKDEDIFNQETMKHSIQYV